MICYKCDSQICIPEEFAKEEYVKCPVCKKGISVRGKKNISLLTLAEKLIPTTIVIVVIIVITNNYLDDRKNEETSSYSEPTRPIVHEIRRDTYGVRTRSDFQILESYFNGDSQALIDLNSRRATTILLEGLRVRIRNEGRSYMYIELLDGHWKGERYYVHKYDLR